MIPKGNQRGGGRQLATHLLNQFDNDHVEVVDLRGSVAQDLHGAFHEWYAQSKATRCRKYLYSLSVNPDLAKYDLTREQYLDFIARTERSLNLVGQPRAVVFHVKHGREHCHTVWCRIDSEAGKAVQMGYDRLKLRTVAQEFARDYGLTLPPRMRENGRTDRFNERAKQSKHNEKQQQERSGISKEERMQAIKAAWEKHTADPHAFVQDLEQKGYHLARGDSGRYVVIDHAGEVHSLYKQIEGVKSPQVKAFLGEAYPLKDLRDVEAARAAALQNGHKQQAVGKEEVLEPQARTQGHENAPPEQEQPEQQRHEDKTAAYREQEAKARRDELARKHQERRAELDIRRDEMEKRIRGEMRALLDLHAGEKDGALAARAANQPRGMLAFLTRITGIQAYIEARRIRQDAAREQSHKTQGEALERRHGRERQEIERRSANLAAVEARERLSLEIALKRQEFQRAREIAAGRATDLQIELKPEFNRAVHPEEGQQGGGESRAAKKKGLLADLFTRAQKSFSKGDLQAAFDKAKDPARTPPASSGGREHDEEFDPEKLEQAEKAKEDLQRRQREQERDRKDRGPDRGR